MMEVKEVLRRLRAGQGLREVARETGLDRKTVRRYAEAAAELGERELTDELAGDVVRRVQSRPEPEPSE